MTFTISEKNYLLLKTMLTLTLKKTRNPSWRNWVCFSILSHKGLQYELEF